MNLAAASSSIGGRVPVRALLVALAAVLGGPSAAGAQFSVRPVIVELHAEARPELSTLVIKNEGTFEMQFRVYVGDFDQAENGENLFLAPGTHPRSCSARLSVFPNGARLRPGETQELRLTMQPGAEGCWSMVFVETLVPQAGMVRVAQRIGVKVYSTPQAYSIDGQLAAVKVMASRTDSIRVAIDFRNNGQAPLRPRGTLDIRTLAGETVARTEIEAFSALPGHLRRVTVPLSQRLPAGEYLAIPVLDYGGRDLVGDQVAFRVP
jgi:P pilus assembly chaperone PapD